MKITIITVTYNSEIFLSKCLESVRNQNYNLVDHIVIDGMSTDGTISILNSKKKWLSKLVSEPDFGIYDAMNKGLSLSDGEVIGFLNSDDFYVNNEVISKVAGVFKNNPTVDACYADLIYSSKSDSSKIIRYWKSSEFVNGAFSRGWCPPHPTFFVRKKIYERCGNFNIKYNISSDFELMLRFLEIYKIRTMYIPDIWVNMRLGGASNDSFLNIFKQNKDAISALRDHNLYINPLSFFLNKILNRGSQFFQRPYK